jgi:hypothetical protein
LTLDQHLKTPQISKSTGKTPNNYNIRTIPFLFDIPYSKMAPKSSTLIEVWRQEVSIACSLSPLTPTSSSNPSSSSDTSAPFEPPPIIQETKIKFWKKILKRGSFKSSKSKEEVIKTEMYDEKAVKEIAGGLKVDQEREAERQASSIEIEVVSGQSEFVGLKERRERLERATKLLEGSAKGKT